MNKYRVSEGLKYYIRRILVRSFYSCYMFEQNGMIWCKTNASSDTFHRIVQRAKCEKVSMETGTFYVTTREANNALLMPILLEQAGVQVYQVIDDKDGTRTIH